jgi:hypothetical protein
MCVGQSRQALTITFADAHLCCVHVVTYVLPAGQAWRQWVRAGSQECLSLLCFMCCQVDKRDGSGEKVLMQSRRIDGGTTLEAREAAIQEFNRPDTGAAADCVDAMAYMGCAMMRCDG